MSVVRIAVASTTLLLGTVCLLVAVVNLFNVDDQSRAVLGGFALAGLLLILLGGIFVHRTRRRIDSVPPPP